MPDVILPVLDEAEAIPRVLAAMPEQFHPIVVDNGSNDGSGELAAELGAEVVSEPQRGFGSACHAGLLAAQREVICFMDCDGSLDPGHLRRLLAAHLAGCDLVLGARMPEPGAWPGSTYTGNCSVLSLYVSVTTDSNFTPSFSAVAGAMTAALSQVSLVSGSGISWSHPLFAKRPS